MSSRNPVLRRPPPNSSISGCLFCKLTQSSPCNAAVGEELGAVGEGLGLWVGGLGGWGPGLNICLMRTSSLGEQRKRLCSVVLSQASLRRPTALGFDLGTAGLTGRLVDIHECCLDSSFFAAFPVTTFLYNNIPINMQ